MVRRQLVARGITDERVVAAMQTVEREAFMAPEQREEAYGDHACPIDCGQTISQPYTVAFMAMSAHIKSTDRILEIGTGSGYGAAILSRLAETVYTIERIPALAKSAAARLREQHCDNVHVHQGDGTHGLPAHAPYDAIVVTAGAKELPAAYPDQLADGGRIIIPVGNDPQQQQMLRFTKAGEYLRSESLGSFVFVPLVGDSGW